MDSDWKPPPRLKAEGVENVRHLYYGRRIIYLTPGLTLSLPDWTWGKLTKKNLTSLSQSCQHVYCMTIPQEEFWCFVKLWTLWALCLCDRAVPQKHPDFLSQESSQSPAPFSIMSFVNINNILLTPPDPASCEPVKLSISRMGVVEIVFDIIAHICLFNALLLCSTSLNRFMSKNT